MNQEINLIKTKLRLLNLSDHLNNVTKACKLRAYSRDSFYRIKQLYDTGGQTALLEISHSTPVLKNLLGPSIEETVVKMAFDYLAYG